jgi:hypothetical protein
MTVIGQFVGFAGRSVGAAIDGSGADTNPWKFEFQSKDGGSSSVDIRDSSGFYFEYLPLLTPPGDFNHAGDLVDFRPVEAVFQGFPGGPSAYPKGVVSRTLQIFGWVTYTLHWAGAEYEDTTPYVVLVDPDNAGCYILANYQEIQLLSPPAVAA